MSNLLNMRVQLADLANLEDGWYCGNQGRQLPKSGIEWLIESWDRFCPADLQLPFLCATLEGNVRSEWFLGELEISLEIDLKDFSGIYSMIDRSTYRKSQNKELMFDLKNDHGWVKLFKRLRRCLLIDSL